MVKQSSLPVIRLRGVRHNNLKNFDIDLPLKQLIVITGLSGSGKSSLAFDTLFAEGQRRYIETFSPYARQFFDRMDKPQVDSIEGIPPAIAIEQRNSVKTSRSTVGTMTEICDYMKLLWPQISRLYCRQCHQPVRKDSPQQVWEVLEQAGIDDALITFHLPISEKISMAESLALIGKQGYQRLLVAKEVMRIEDAENRLGKTAPQQLVIVQDRIKLAAPNRSRFMEACEQAYHFGKGKLAIYPAAKSREESLEFDKPPILFSNRFHCAQCDIEYREPSPALFSFNHPVGACPACKGFGRIITIDYNLALPDRSRTLAEGAVKPWQTGTGAESQEDLLKFCRIRKVPIDVPFNQLPKKWQDWVINGDAGYGSDKSHEWPKAWYGIKGYFKWLESKAYKMHVRVLLSRYRAYTLCPDCQGQRFQPESLLYKVAVPQPKNETAPDAPALVSLANFYCLPVSDALQTVQRVAAQYQIKTTDPLGLALNEVQTRIGFLNEVGLGYLTLDRTTRTLSGGETERVNLTTCLGTRLVNTLFVLDEPSVGLHARDTVRLVKILEQLRDAGNTVVVVEHEASVMRAADQVIDIGPGHGASGGYVVFQGPYKELLNSELSLTGQFLDGRRKMEAIERRPVLETATNKSKKKPASKAAVKPIQFLTLANATRHNLKDLTVNIPLGRLVCLTGVSGSGKTTLVRDLLLPLLTAKLSNKDAEKIAEAEANPAEDAEKNDDPETAAVMTETATLANWESIGQVLLVDQAALGKTPRSNPAVYIGAFEDIRDLMAQSEMAKQLGLNSSSFSFNSAQGQCEKCRGAGFEKIEMQFLSDIFVRCPECNGRRYRPHILEIKLSTPAGEIEGKKFTGKAWSVADFLDATVEEAIEFLSAFPDSKPAKRAADNLKMLREVGLGYLQLGQPINTLSGGESQRLKLVRHLAEFTNNSAGAGKPTFFLFDEPTTGLHFEDVRILLMAFQKLVDAGHSVLIIEHNLEVIQAADWVIDLGPEAGANGGKIVAEGTPEMIAETVASHTGEALKANPLFQANFLKPKLAA